MLYEVENKYPADDLSRIADQLAQLGAQFDDPIEQLDRYFAHPVRDFRQTDEALRIRCIGEVNRITYKGPKIDKATKTRVERELPLGTGVEMAGQYVELLETLGFRAVTHVKKRRTGGRFQWQGSTVEIALDEVQNLGSYVELEISVGHDELEAAQRNLLDLALHLGLTNPERRSYLELLEESRGRRSAPSPTDPQ